MDEDALFRQAMRGVRKIRTEPRTNAGKSAPRATAGVARQRADTPASRHHPEPATTWVLKDPGVSRERLRRLAAGRPGVDVELDLHGMNREQAYAAMDACLSRALARNWRVLCVIHGRGMHSSNGRPVLKKAVYDWLRDGPHAGQVLAAIPRPGTAGGACLVLLRRIRC